MTQPTISAERIEAFENAMNKTPSGNPYEDYRRLRIEGTKLLEALIILRAQAQGSEAVAGALDRINKKLSEEGGGTWAAYMMVEIAEAYASPQATLTPAPVAEASHER